MKPLNRKIYGSIPHLPASRLGPSDKQANLGHVKIATEQRRDKHDLIIVSEKLDGSNVGVAKLYNGDLVPLTRAGYEATSSPYMQHQFWAVWVWEHSERFEKILGLGEWCVGEWCIQAHGTRYVFEREPFFLFDIFHNEQRVIYDELNVRNNSLRNPFETPKAYALQDGGPISLDLALQWLEDQPYGVHGAVDKIEGFVWRVERKGVVDFLTKYVRPDKIDGLYLPEMQVGENPQPIYNYWGDSSGCIKHLKNKELLYECDSRESQTSREARQRSDKNSKRVINRKRSNSTRN